MENNNRTPVRHRSFGRGAVFLLDLALIAVLLLTFAYFHHVRPTQLDPGQEIVVNPPDDKDTPDFTESDGKDEPTPSTESDIVLSYNSFGEGVGKQYSLLVYTDTKAPFSSGKISVTYNNVRLTYFHTEALADVCKNWTVTDTDNGDNTSTLTVTLSAEDGKILESGNAFAFLFTANVDLTGLTPYKVEAKDFVSSNATLTTSVTQSDGIHVFGDFRDIYPDEFSSSGVEIDNDTEYKSENVHATWKTVTDNTTWGKNVRYTVVDFYIRNTDYLKAYVSTDASGNITTAKVGTMSEKVGALVAVNSDYISCRDSKTTILVRNGILYSTKNKYNQYLNDLLVMYADGTMECVYYDANNTAMQTFDITGKNIVNVWSFGPVLLDANGHAMDKSQYHSTVMPANPRTAIGYYAPGHYCIVQVEGRNDTEDIPGLRIEEMAQLFESLGCTKAYNLDGGNSSVLTWNHNVINNPSGGGRKSSDIIYVVKE